MDPDLLKWLKDTIPTWLKRIEKKGLKGTPGTSKHAASNNKNVGTSKVRRQMAKASRRANRPAARKLSATEKKARRIAR